MAGDAKLKALVAGKRYAVLGLGATGLATAKALSAAGALVTAWDDHNRPEGEAGFEVANLAEMDLSVFDALVMSPGIPHSFPKPHPVAAKAKAAGLPLIGDIELLCLSRPTGNFIGITGTNGKSTTTALTTHILQSAGMKVVVGGNLGPAALSLDDPSLSGSGEDGWHVLEISSYQAELLDAARFDLVGFLNLTPDHIARHGDLDGYREAKWRLLDRLTTSGKAAVATDDATGADFAQRLGQERLVELLSVEAIAKMVGGNLALAGRHNLQNACIAAALCTEAGLDLDQIAGGLASFPGLAHRQELVPTEPDDGVLYINDSKATNAEATQVALETFATGAWSIHWILGGQAKEGGIDALARFFPAITRAYTIGDAGDELAEKLSPHCAVDRCETLDVAVAQAIAQARSESGRKGASEPALRPVVLLSPACASWDQFDSFEHRGDSFKSLIRHA